MRELDYSKIGMRIRQVRKAKGWSQGILAQKCGISMSFLGHIERGTRVMSMETFVVICNVLDTGADELLWGIVQPSGSMLGMWGQMDGPDMGGNQGIKDGKVKPDDKMADSYALYIRIMKSVAEIINEGSC